MMRFFSLRSLHVLLVLAAMALLVVGIRVLAGERASTMLELRASVPMNCTVDIAPTAKASSLDLRAGETDVMVGVVTENCNARNGYTVAISSDGRGQLRSSASGAAPAAYQVRYDGAEGAIADQLVANRDQPSFGRQGNLIVTIPGNASAVAGDYSANLSLVITAK
jgi:hypothetical protein